MKPNKYDVLKKQLADMIVVGEKHNWGINPITGQERQGRWNVTRQDIKKAFNDLANVAGSNHAVNNDLNVIKGHRQILAGAITIDCISRLTKAEFHDAEDMLNRYADDYSFKPTQEEKKEDEQSHSRGIRI